MSFSDNAGVSDGKIQRQAILQKANVILTGLLNNLASNYITSTAFTVFAVQLKAMAFEAARIISISQDVSNDIIFTTTRPEFISQNIESFLFYNQRFAHFDQTDAEVRSFLLALIQAYFKGATASSIQSALTFEFSLEGQISFTLTEPIYTEYDAPDIDFVRLQHQFTVAIEVGNTNTDIVTLQTDVEFVVNLIKPAHTLLETQFIFTEPQDNTDSLGRINCIILTDSHGNPLIDQYGFEVTVKLGPRSICDVFRMDMFEYGYEDFRFDCLSMTQMQQLLEVPSLLNSTTFKTQYGPVSDGNGNLISNVDQITVLVNGVQVEVQSVNGLTGIVVLAAPVPTGALVQVSYSWLRRYFDTFTLNNVTSVLNQFDPYDDSLPKFQYSTLIWSPAPSLPNKSPITYQYVYSGFDALDSSLLNDPDTLVFNRVDSRDKLNDASTWQSTNYASGNTVTLNDGESLFVYRQEKTLLVNNTTSSVFILNNPLSLLNSLVSSVLGSTTQWQISTDSVNKVYASLDVIAVASDGVPGRLKPMCEDGLSIALGAVNGATGPFSDVYKGILNEADPLFITNTLASVINVNTLYGANENVTEFFMSLMDTEIEDAYATSGIVEDLIPVSGFVSGFGPKDGFELDILFMDCQTYVSGFFLLNTTGYVLNDPTDTLFPYPQQVVLDEIISGGFEMDVLFTETYSHGAIWISPFFGVNFSSIQDSLISMITGPGFLTDSSGGYILDQDGGRIAL